MTISRTLLPALLFLATLLSSCNIFGWTSTVDSSDDYDLVLLEAESRLASDDISGALKYYSLALELRPDAPKALAGRITCRMLHLTSGRSVCSVFPALFITTDPADAALFDETPAEQQKMLGTLQVGALAGLAGTGATTAEQQKMLGTLQALAADAARFDTLTLSPVDAPFRGQSYNGDAACALTLLAALLAADGNTNGIPGEATDGTSVRADFSILTNGTAPSVSVALSNAHRACLLARAHLDRLAAMAPAALESAPVYSNFAVNLGRLTGATSR